MMSLKGRGAPELLSGWLGGRCAGGQILDLNWIISLRISACFGGERERGAAYPMREYSVFLIHVQKADVRGPGTHNGEGNCFTFARGSYIHFPHYTPHAAMQTYF